VGNSCPTWKKVPRTLLSTWYLLFLFSQVLLRPRENFIPNDGETRANKIVLLKKLRKYPKLDFVSQDIDKVSNTKVKRFNVDVVEKEDCEAKRSSSKMD
jgi:hypothetical protein